MASACIIVDGEIVAAAHEERFTRIKSDVGFPYNSIKFCLSKTGLSGKDIDVVALSNKSFNLNGIANILFKRQSKYSIDDWIYENKHYWFRKFFKNQLNNKSYFEIMGGNNRGEKHYYDFRKINFSGSSKNASISFNIERKNVLKKFFNINHDKIMFLPHYLLHHYHAYYSSENRDTNSSVIVHLEGDGGKYNTGISVPTKNGIKWLCGKHNADLGRLYQWITLLLGMKPYHHEYKIMGLSPYATEKEVLKSYKIFKDLFQINSNTSLIEYKNKPRDLYYSFLDKFEGHRFDGIAGALQRYTEDILLSWFKTINKKTKRKNFFFSGGVAMNVKANGILSQQNFINNLFVPLSPSDETNVFGGGYLIQELNLKKNKKNPNKYIKGLKNIYLGPSFDNSYILNLIEKKKLYKKFNVFKNISNKKLAKNIFKGKIYGRFVGRSEFGQRALGNRSIIACPGLDNIVEKINLKIKYRDFWMPFCPTILKEDSRKILLNKNNIQSKFMTNSFSINPYYKRLLKGTFHEADNTIRPQILSKIDNPAYYDLIFELKKLTGLGAIINTSFNLHGYPIVGSPDDAVDTLIKSELDGVILNNILLYR